MSVFLTLALKTSPHPVHLSQKRPCLFVSQLERVIQHVRYPALVTRQVVLVALSIVDVGEGLNISGRLLPDVAVIQTPEDAPPFITPFAECRS